MNFGRTEYFFGDVFAYAFYCNIFTVGLGIMGDSAR